MLSSTEPMRKFESAAQNLDDQKLPRQMVWRKENSSMLFVVYCFLLFVVCSCLSLVVVCRLSLVFVCGLSLIVVCGCLSFVNVRP